MRDLLSLLKKDVYDQGGIITEEKRRYIHSLVQSTGSKYCVEIGVFKGSSTLSFAESLELTGGKIVGIDPWSFDMSKNTTPLGKDFENYLWNELLKNQETFDGFFNNLSEIIKNNNLSETITLIRKPSEEAFIDFNLDSIDILHIDGNHDEMNASRDVLLYLPLVKNGGHIIMDDSNWVGVTSAINKYLKNQCVLVNDFGYFSCYKKIK